MSNFRVGQRVICIKSHSMGIFKKGQIFVVASINNTPCCNALGLDVSIHTNHENIICTCGAEYKNDNHWGAELFRPIDELSNITYDEVMQWIESGQPIEILN